MVIALAFQSTARSNIVGSGFCDLPITFPAIFVILASLFLFKALRFPYQAVQLKDRMLSTRLL